MTVNTYLFFDGTCEAAFKFYEKALGGKIVAMLTHENTPAAGSVESDWLNKIIHARMIVGSTVLMGSDAPPQYYSKPEGYSVCLLLDTPEEAEKAFAALSENANVTMPMEETFWAHRFGMLVDQFGTHWMVNCEKAMA